MNKTIVFIVMALISIVLMGQEQPPVLPDEQPQARAEEPSPVPVQPQGRDLKTVRFPKAFIHAGKEYPAGDYRLVLIVKEGVPMFSVQDAARMEPLFEDLAVVKARNGARTGTTRLLSGQLMRDKEYFRVIIAAPGEWLVGFFLVKK
jgi:hypothetical protein